MIEEVIEHRKQVIEDFERKKIRTTSIIQKLHSNNI